MGDEPATWTNTTHDWSASVDCEHLRTIRRNAPTYAAGGLQHPVLEVISYADDEARCAGRRGMSTVSASSGTTACFLVDEDLVADKALDSSCLTQFRDITVQLEP